MRQSRSSGDKGYARLVVQPARRFFWLTLTGYLAGAWAALMFLTDAAKLFGYDVAPFTVMVRLVTGTLAIAVWAAAMQARRLVMDLHDEYMGEFDVVETTTTEESAIVNDEGPRMQMTAPPPESPSNFQVGKFGFTRRQLASLAVNIANGGSFSQNAMVKAGIISDRTNPEQANQAKEIQADFIRLGYAYTSGRATIPSTAGLRYFAQYAPTPNLAEMLSRGQTTNNNQQQPPEDDEEWE